MSLFGRPDVDDLTAKLDLKGLCKALGDKDPAVRQAAVSAFGKKKVLDRFEQERNVARFGAILDRADEPPVRKKVIAALIRVLRSDVSEQFGYALRAFDQAIAGRAVVQPGGSTFPLDSAPRAYETRIRQELALLEGLGSEAVDPLRRVLGDELLAPYAAPILGRIERRETEALAGRT